MIHLPLLFPGPLYFACSNIKHLDRMLTDWMLHEEVDWNDTWTLLFVLFVSVFSLCAMMIGSLNFEHLAAKFIGSVIFLCMYCDVTPFGWRSRLTVKNIPYPFFLAWSKNAVAREVVLPTQTWFLLEDLPCLACFHMTLANDHLVKLLNYCTCLIGTLEYEPCWYLPQLILMYISAQPNLINNRNKNKLFSLTHPRLV